MHYYALGITIMMINGMKTHKVSQYHQKNMVIRYQSFYHELVKLFHWIIISSFALKIGLIY